MADDRILVGVLGAPHGVRGDLRLKSFTQNPLAIAGYAPLSDQSGRRSFAFAAARLVKDDMLVVRIEGVDDRDAAAALTNTRLFVPRDRLPPADEDEFYHADLVGLAVVGRDGTALGSVQAVLDFGAGEILEIRPPDGSRAFMLPFTRAAIPDIDLAGRRIVADPPAFIEVKDKMPDDGVTPD
jgi:16S rRNA processing protein RimM